VNLPNFTVIGKTVAEIWQFFQDGGYLPSWICDAHVQTTQEGYLVVVIVTV